MNRHPLDMPRFVALIATPLLFISLGLSRLAPHVSMTSTAAPQEKSAPEGKATGRAGAPAVGRASASSLRGAPTLFGYTASEQAYISNAFFSWRVRPC